MSVTLETLNLQITQDSLNAVNGLESLENALVSLQNVGSKFNLNKVSKQLRRISKQTKTTVNQMKKANIQNNATNGSNVKPQVTPQVNTPQVVTPKFNTQEAKQAKSAYDGITGSFKKMRSTGMLLRATLFGIGTAFALTVGKATSYIEDMNLASVSLGSYFKEAYNYGMQVQNLLGIDVGKWLKNQGQIMNMVSGFGLADDQAYQLSLTLNQLSYDFASFFNTDIETAMSKIKSGIAGQTRPLREWGISLDQANLQQIALKHGITQSVSEMSQADKAILRTYAIMEGGQNAIGDMARTIYQPANAMRVLSELSGQAARAIGFIFLPIISKILPYLQALVMLLRNAATAIASFFGMKLPSFDAEKVNINLGGAASNAGDLDNATGGAAKNLGKAAKKAKELKSYTMGIDKLNIIDPNTVSDTGSGGGGGGGGSVGGGGGGGIGLDSPSIDDWLKGASNQAEKIAEKLKNLLPLIGAIGLAFLSWKIAHKVYDFLTENKIGISLLRKLGKIAKSLGLSNKQASKLTKLLGAKNTIKLGIASAIFVVVTRLIQAVKNSETFRKGLQVIYNVLKWIATKAYEVYDRIKTWVDNLNLSKEKMDLIYDVIAIIAGIIISKLSPAMGAFVLISEGLIIFTKVLGWIDKLAQKIEELTGNKGLADFVQTFLSLGTAILGIKIYKLLSFKNVIKMFEKFSVTNVIDGLKSVASWLKVVAEKALLAKDGIGEFLGSLSVSTIAQWAVGLAPLGASLYLYSQSTGHLTRKLKKLDKTEANIKLKMEDASGPELEKLKQEFAEVEAEKKKIQGELEIRAKLKAEGKDPVSLVKKFQSDNKDKLNVKVPVTYENYEEGIDPTRNQTKQKPIEIPVGIQNNLTELEKETNDQSAKVKAEPINIKAMLSEKAEDIKEKVKDIVSKASTWTKENLIPFLAELKTTYEDIKEKLSTIKDDAVEWLSKNVLPFLAKLKTKYDDIKKQVSNIKDKVQTWLKDKYIGFKAKISTLASKIKEEAKGIINKVGTLYVNAKLKLKAGIEGLKNGFKKIVNDYVITPLNTKLRTSFAGKIASIFNKGKIPQIPLLAQGGLLGTGQMFIAREAGPELVGKIGNQNAVVNNDQIVSSVSRGVAAGINSEAQIQLLSEQNALLKEILDKTGVTLDGNKLLSSVEKAQARRGRKIVIGGY